MPFFYTCISSCFVVTCGDTKLPVKRGYGLLCCREPDGSEHVTTVPGGVGAVGVRVEERFPLPAPIADLLVRLAWKLPQLTVSPTEVLAPRTNVGLLSHVNTVLAQLRESPCVTVHVKITSSPGHAVALPPCSTLDTNTTSAITKVSTGVNQKCYTFTL